MTNTLKNLCKKYIINIRKLNNTSSIIKIDNRPNWSYGKFLDNNPNASKSERKNAIKIFLNNTR